MKSTNMQPAGSGLFQQKYAGNVTVELAIVLPVFAVVLALIFHFGLYLYWQNQLDNAAHRLLKLVVLEQSKGQGFNGDEAAVVLRELTHADVYGNSIANIGVRFSIVSDINSRNMTAQAGANCYERSAIQNISQFGVGIGSRMEPRNIAILNICTNINDALPLAAFTVGNFAAGFGNIQRNSYYPVSPSAFAP